MCIVRFIWQLVDTWKLDQTSKVRRQKEKKITKYSHSGGRNEPPFHRRSWSLRLPASRSDTGGRNGAAPATTEHRTDRLGTDGDLSLVLASFRPSSTGGLATGLKSVRVLISNVLANAFSWSGDYEILFYFFLLPRMRPFGIPTRVENLQHITSTTTSQRSWLILVAPFSVNTSKTEGVNFKFFFKAFCYFYLDFYEPFFFCFVRFCWFISPGATLIESTDFLFVCLCLCVCVSCVI